MNKLCADCELLGGVGEADWTTGDWVKCDAGWASSGGEARKLAGGAIGATLIVPLS